MCDVINKREKVVDVIVINERGARLCVMQSPRETERQRERVIEPDGI